MNPGDTVAGESITVGGNAGEVFAGKIYIQFIGVQSNPNATIVQKYYLP